MALGLQLLGKVRRGPETGGGDLVLYRAESWLFMSPLKCSNFFSVSSLKEPPAGWALGRQFGKPEVLPGPTLELLAWGEGGGPGATALHQVACWGHLSVTPPGQRQWQPGAGRP